MAKFVSLLLAAISFCLPTATAQTPTDKPGMASVTGRITHNSQPLPGVTVVLENSELEDMQSSPRRPVSAKTDAEGRYRLSGIAAGQYLVSPRMLAHVIPREDLAWLPGKSVKLNHGEQLENVDFALVKGGVIEGKITDDLDRPVIAQRVYLRRVGSSNSARIVQATSSNFQMFETDDRGVFRLYGLPAGRYLLSIGGESRVLGSRRLGKDYPLTFYPGVGDEKAARHIEVSEGSEVTNINIKLPKAEKSYQAKGRVIDAVLGAPIAGVALIYKFLGNDATAIGASRVMQESTNSQGEFTLLRLTSGKYAVTLQATEATSEYYSDPVMFDIEESDTEGLEIKAYRGASINGIVVIKGTTDPVIAKQVVKVRVLASPVTPSPMQLTNIISSHTTNPDGTFRVAAIPPTKISLWTRVLGVNSPLRMSHIERDGVEISPTLELSAGEQITGIKVVMVFGSGVIRGQVVVVNGTLSLDTQYQVTALQSNTSARASTKPAQVDARGKFVLEGLAPGEYELVLFPFSRNGAPVNASSMSRAVRQKIIVGEGETPVTLTLDLGEKKLRNQ